MTKYSKITILLTAAILCFSQPARCEEGYEMKVIGINHRAAKELYGIINHLKSPDGKISIDEHTNSIIVSDKPSNIRQISSLIKQLDIKPDQVEIEVIVAEVTEGFLKESGIGYGRTVIPGNEFLIVGKLLHDRENADIRSRMTVRTISNRPAKIQATVEEIFGHVIMRYGKADDKEYVIPIIARTGSVLEVLSRVNNDGSILVSLRPSISETQKDGTLYGRSALTEVLINDGDTIIIGGLGKKESVTSSGTFLFRRKKKREKTVMIFLTANTIDD